MKKLPWSFDMYLKLEPGDLDPGPPTPKQRIRVAAAIATLIRDCNMIGKPVDANAETIRAILTMNDVAWARDIGHARGIIERYDVEDPFVRWTQTTGN